MVMGIVAVLMSCLGMILGVPGLIFGILSIRKKKEQNGMAIAGIILSSIAILITIVYLFIVIITAIATSSSYHTYY